jgi:hypothetical protein
MLAWVHHYKAAEREFLESLFGSKSDGRTVGSIRKFDSNDEKEDWICELMDLVVGNLCLPLKVCMAPLFHSFFLLVCCIR